MAGTYSQLYIHVVFSVKCRENLLAPKWRSDIHKYIAGIIRNKGHKPIIVGGVADHVHIFFGLRPVMSISDLVRDVKNNSSKYINDQKLVNGRFSWQEGYGAFSYSNAQVETIYNYIKNQEIHHNKKKFREEYVELLKDFCIDYDEKFLFEWCD